jgi:hypothetical protein
MPICSRIGGSERAYMVLPRTWQRLSGFTNSPRIKVLQKAKMRSIETMHLRVDVTIKPNKNGRSMG